MPVLCIYHGNCVDGFAAAWIVKQTLPDTVFHPGIYGEPPPNPIDENTLIILADFSYSLPVMEELSYRRGVLILDHHKTAQAACKDITHPKTWQGFLTSVQQDRWEGAHSQLYGIFDMDRSGAGIAWDFFNPGVWRPGLIDLVEDRDLWRFKLSGSREIHEVITSYPWDFDVFSKLVDSFAVPDGQTRMLYDGAAILRKHYQDIENLLPIVTRRMIINGYNVQVANLPITMTSDAGHLLAKNEPFAACYWDTPKGRIFSLRSVDGGVDVSEIAEAYGGGGHEHAAGFEVSFEAAADFEIGPGANA